MKTLGEKIENSKTILIRLLSVDIGYKFINEKFPNWLEQEYEKWLYVEKEKNYCL